jgi:hypothetical protein
LAQSRLRLDLTQPLILRAISLPDVPSESRQLVRRQPDQLVSDHHRARVNYSPVSIPATFANSSRAQASAIRFQWCQLVSRQNRSAATEPASGHALSQSLGSTCWTKLGGLITHRGTAAVTALHRPRCNFQHCESAVNAAGGHYAHFWSRPSFGSDRYFTNLTETFGHAGHSKVRLS